MFYNNYYSNQIGGWSTEGLTVDKNHSTKASVACLTNHLTSFAVLVSIQDETPVRTEAVKCNSGYIIMKHTLAINS